MTSPPRSLIMPSGCAPAPTRVLYVTPWGKRIFGGERWIVNLCHYIDKSRFQPIAVLPTTGQLSEALKALKTPVFLQNMNWLRAEPRRALFPSTLEVIHSARQLSRLIRETDAHLLHVFAGEALEAVYLASLMCNVPVVSTIQLSIQFPRLHNIILARIGRVVAVSQMCRQQLLADGIPEHKIAHILTGIDPEPFLEASGGDAVRQEFNIPPDAPLIGIIASLEPNKAQDILLQAATHLRAEFPNARYLLVGTDKTASEGQKGYFHQKLERQVEELGLSKQVIFTGFRRDIPNILAALDILVLISNMEALPVTIMEAMTAAKPVVATAVGGILDLVEDGRSGILVPPRDPIAVASALERLLINPSLAQQMGKEGRKLALRRMTVQGAVRQNEVMYEEVLAEWQGRR